MASAGFQFDIKNPEWYYFKLELSIEPAVADASLIALDHLTWKAYLMLALKRLHGLVGESIPVEIQHLSSSVKAPRCIIRTPWDSKQKVATALAGFTTSLEGVAGLSSHHHGAFCIVAQSDFLTGVTGPSRMA